MTYMSVTLDVSKNSGWLNDDAAYQVEQRAYDRGERCDLRAGVHGVTAAQGACTGGGPRE